MLSDKFISIVKETINAHNMLKPNDSVLTGLSGGPDSVALLHTLISISSELSISLAAAHLNHCLRGSESDRDEDFVKKLCARLNIPCYTQRINVIKYQQQHGLSLEEAARNVRYDFFKKIAEKHGFNKLALAHHADDNAELVLMYMLRGSGPLGLSGIPPVRDGWIIRPFIKVSRAEILKFSDSNKYDYVIDKSNSDIKYMRNKIRCTLLPLLKDDYNPGVAQTLNRMASIIREEEDWLKEVVRPIFDDAVIKKQREYISLSLDRLNVLHKALRRRVLRMALAEVRGNLRRITLFHIDAVDRLIQKGKHGKSLDLPYGIKAGIEEKTLVFFKKENYKSLKECQSFEYLIKGPGIIRIKELECELHISITNIKMFSDYNHTGQNTGFFDIGKIRFPMLLRNCRPGDRFTPLGMKGSQKIKKYFINQKIPENKRWNCPVLLNKGKIIWLVGHRIDNSARVRPDSKSILKVKLA
ncbi:tRNA(Ile)-lysidine synthase [Candidatus Magnetomoraceae bacterium gMMP-15]